jgi:L-rhamnose mutarotase
MISILFGCQISVPGMAGSKPPSHQAWNELLQANVSSKGIVNYKGFLKQKEKLVQYLELLSANAPDR